MLFSPPMVLHCGFYLCTGGSLLEALFPALRKAAAALSAQLALTFFVPLCLTGLAIMARVQVQSNSMPLLLFR